MALTLRPAEWRDSATLFSWRVRNEAAPWFQGRPLKKKEHNKWLWARLPETSPSKIWIAEEDGVPVGSVRLDSNGELTVEVVEERRGEGIGTQLAVTGCALAAEMGHPRVKVSVDATNLSARRTLIKAGFVEVDDVKFYIWKP